MIDFADTVKALAQVVPSAAPVSFETAVVGFAAASAVYIGKKLAGMDEKLSQTLILLHGVPEQQGQSGMVRDVKDLKDFARRVEGVNDHHLNRIEDAEKSIKHVEKVLDTHYGTGE